MERRSTVYKKILDDHGKTQEGSGQYISHTIYTRNTLSRFSTTFCIGECSKSSIESIILILVRKLVVDRLYFLHSVRQKDCLLTVIYIGIY